MATCANELPSSSKTLPKPALSTPSGGAAAVERPSRIAEEIWRTLPQGGRVVVRELCDENQQLREENQQLRDDAREAGSHPTLNSSNSSLPPSSDRPWDKPVKRKKARGRKRGGQKGHAPHVRSLVPPERVKHVKDYYPSKCVHCESDFQGDDEGTDDVRRHQVLDLPEIVPDVTEHRLHARTCPHCKRRTRARLPKEVPAGNFGPRITALIAVLAIAHHMSKRQIKALLHDLLDVDIAIGTVVDLQVVATEALAQPVEEVHEQLKASEGVTHQDETKWPEAGKDKYAWVTASGPYAYYEVGCSRSGETLVRQLGGPAFKGNVVSDRYAAYKCYPMEKRGICHSHLIRDYQKIADRGEHVEEIGSTLLNLERDIFSAWHTFKDGSIPREDLQSKLVDISVPYEAALLRGMAVEDPKVAGMCANIYGHWEAIWNFGWVEGMEPTNNEAERTARPLVVLRKKCFGTQSALGSLFVARMATVIETCRRQGRSVHQFLQKALEAHYGRTAPPSLVVTAAPNSA